MTVSFNVTLSVTTEKVEEWPVLFEKISDMAQELADRYPMVSVSFHRMVDDEQPSGGTMTIENNTTGEEDR